MILTCSREVGSGGCWGQGQNHFMPHQFPPVAWIGSSFRRPGLWYQHLSRGDLPISGANVRVQINGNKYDLYTPIEETVWAMNQMINEGKALYWGTSEWNAYQIRKAYDFARQEHLRPPLMEQPEYNMFKREKIEKEFAPLYEDIGLGTTIWSPLASGLLTGKYNDGIPEGSRLDLEKYDWLRKRLLESEKGRAKLEKVKRLAPIADDLGISMPQLALAWCLNNKNVSTVITGASKVEQVEQNMETMDVIDRVDEEVIAKIEEVLDNKPKEEQDWRR